MDIDEETFAENIEHLTETGTLYYGPEILPQLAMTMRGEPDTFGSTPFDPYLASIAEQQQAVSRQHDVQLKKRPKNVRKAVADELINFNASRVQHRKERNYDSFQCREHYDFEIIPEELRETAQRVLTGHGSPAENLLIADILGMPTVELASTSLFYGNPDRMKILTPHRTAVEECIALFNGTLITSQAKNNGASWSRADDFQIKSGFRKLSNDHEPEVADVFSMTRTRLIGIIDEYRIFERSSFLLDVTKLEPELIEGIKAVDPNDPDRIEHILGLPKFYISVKKILANNQYGVGVPVATTTWAVHTERDRKLNTSRDLKRHHVHRNRPDVHGTPFDAHYELLGLN